MKFSTYEKLMLNKNLTFPELIEWFQSYTNLQGKNIQITPFLAQAIPSVFPEAITHTIEYFEKTNPVNILKDKDGKVIKVWLDIINN